MRSPHTLPRALMRHTRASVFAPSIRKTVNLSIRLSPVCVLRQRGVNSMQTICPAKFATKLCLGAVRENCDARHWRKIWPWIGLFKWLAQRNRPVQMPPRWRRRTSNQCPMHRAMFLKFRAPLENIVTSCPSLQSLLRKSMKLPTHLNPTRNASIAEDHFPIPKKSPVLQKGSLATSAPS